MGSECILVVEGDENDRERPMITPRDKGYEVDEARDGEEGHYPAQKDGWKDD
jgi:DNA-binding response OmpR family regulator